MGRVAAGQTSGGEKPVKTVISNRYVTMLSRIALGAVFILASIEKISAPEAFASAVQAYKLSPFPLINLFALIVPWMELICGIFLVAGLFVRSSAALVSMLLVLFVGGIVSAILRRLEIDCGCFGSAHASPVGWLRVVEDMGLLLLGMQICLFPRSAFALEGLLRESEGKSEGDFR